MVIYGNTDVSAIVQLTFFDVNCQKLCQRFCSTAILFLNDGHSIQFGHKQTSVITAEVDDNWYARWHLFYVVIN